MSHAELKCFLSQSTINTQEWWRLTDTFVCRYVLIEPSNNKLLVGLATRVEKICFVYCTCLVCEYIHVFIFTLSVQIPFSNFSSTYLVHKDKATFYVETKQNVQNLCPVRKKLLTYNKIYKHPRKHKRPSDSLATNDWTFVSIIKSLTLMPSACYFNSMILYTGASILHINVWNTFWYKNIIL